ncbi:MAG: HAD-IA family hydrolase [Betaproteobacteria bacterium]
MSGTPNPAVRAVLWDFGGVFSSSPFDAFAAYERSRGLPEGLLRKVNSINPDSNAWARLERAEISVDEFDAAFDAEARSLGHSVPGKDVVKLLFGEIRPAMVEALRRCRVAFRTACITNNFGDIGPGLVSPERAAAWREVVGLFDLVVESSKVGIRKPEPAIYDLACRNLGVDPRAAVYLDDLGINLKPARSLGMQTIKVTDPGAAIAELEVITGLELQ